MLIENSRDFLLNNFFFNILRKISKSIKKNAPLLYSEGILFMTLINYAYPGTLSFISFG